jgi:hypothetical protein
LNEEDGSYEALLKDNCRFKYFFNSDNIDSSRIPESLLQRVTTLWMHGYVIPEENLEKIPNLNMVYSTSCCVGKTYWAARTKMNTVNDKEKLYEYNVKCSIPEVVRWIDNVNGFELRGDDGDELFECDAPYQFQCY